MFLSNNKEITRKQVEELLGVKQRRANNILNEMIEKDIIIREGASSSIVYKPKLK